MFLDLDLDEYSCCYDPKDVHSPYRIIAPANGGADENHAVLDSPWSDIPPHGFPRPRAMHIIKFATALLKSAILLHRKPVKDLGAIATRLGGKSPSSEMTSIQAAAMFRYLLSLTPFRPECLLRSFALLHFLDSYGLRADWVFGVQLFPFRAHCWVASGQILLNEVSHGIEDYEVIWIVGAKA